MRTQAEAEAKAKADAAKNNGPSRKEIMAKLDKLGIEYDKWANKDTLMALLEAAQNNNAEETQDDPEEIQNDPEDNQDDSEDDEGAE